MTTLEELTQEAKRLAVAYAEACAESAVDVGSARSHHWGAYLATPERALFASIDALAKRAEAAEQMHRASALGHEQMFAEAQKANTRAESAEALVEQYKTLLSQIVRDAKAQDVLFEWWGHIDAAIQQQEMQRLTERGAKVWADVPSAADWVDQIRGNDSEQEKSK